MEILIRWLSYVWGFVQRCFRHLNLRGETKLIWSRVSQFWGDFTAHIFFSEADARTPELARSKREPVFDKCGDARAGVLEPNERLMLDGAELLPH